jgi:integral membrane protein
MSLNFRSSAIDRLRLFSILDGISYLILLGIAMPLKYLADEPLAVRIVGMAHGVLFSGLVRLSPRRAGSKKTLISLVCHRLPLRALSFCSVFSGPEAEIRQLTAG